MKLKQRISSWLSNFLAPNLKSDRSGNSFIYFLNGDTLSYPDDKTAFIRAKEMDPFVGIAVSKIAMTMAGLPVKVYRKEIVNGKTEYEEDINHPANEILENPNPFNSFTDIQSHIAQSLILSGDVYLSIEKAKSGIEIYPKESDKMKVKPDSTGAIASYVYYDKQPGEKTYKPEEICHIRNYDCTSPYYGRSPLVSIQDIILLNYYATQTNKAIFRNGPIPAGMFLTDFDLTDEQKATLIKSFEARHKGAENRGKIGVAPAFVKDFKIIQFDVKDMLYNEQTRLMREIIFAQLGLPPFTGGVMEYANYANARPQDRLFYQNTIIPMARIDDEAKTRQILWRYYDPSRSYVYRHDFTGIPALQENEKEKAANYAILVRHDILTANEARQVGYNLPPVEGGEDLYSTRNRLRPTVSGEMNVGDDYSKDRFALIRFQKDKLSPTKYSWWKSFDIRLSQEEEKFERLIKQYFRGQQRRVISALDNYTNNGKTLSKLDIYSKAEIPSDPDKIFNLAAENEILKEMSTPVFREGLRRGAESVYDEFSLDFVFNVRNVRVIEAIDSFNSALTRINDLNYDTIRSILSEGYNNGLSLSEITKNIRDEFDIWVGYRPERIARTEMLGVLNRGGILGYEQAEIAKMEWVTTQDEYTRDAHSAVDGQTINVGERFNVGGELLMHPGDPSGSAGNIVNCRCTTMPVL